MTECSRCGIPITETGLESLQPISCPQCGMSFTRSQKPGKVVASLIRGYFNDLGSIITHPTDFFQRMPVTGGMARPLAFALVTHWIGSSIGFLWKLAVGGIFLRYASDLFRVMNDVIEVDYPGRGGNFLLMRDRILDWLNGAGPVLIDPFYSLFSILFTSFFVFVGARILIPATGPGARGSTLPKVTYESAVRIVCFGMTPSILAAVPFFGGFISSLLIALVTILGVKEVYKVGTGRSIVIALFPKILFLGIIGAGLAVLIVGVFQIFASLLT